MTKSDSGGGTAPISPAPMPGSPGNSNSLDVPRPAEGTNTGGGGTGIRVAGSSTLLFWDLFIVNTYFREQAVGDQLSVPGKEKLEKIELTQLKSFALLKEAVFKIRDVYPNIFKLIGEEQFLENGAALKIFATSLYPKNLEELHVVSSAYTPGEFEAMPLARFDDDTGFVFLNANLWNQMGIKSQAALLLHERLRSLQLKYDLTNQILQSLVYFIIEKDAKVRPFYAVNDAFFAKDPQASLPEISDERALIRFQELASAKLLVAENTVVENPPRVGRHHTHKTLPSGKILDTENCPKIVSGFEMTVKFLGLFVACQPAGGVKGVGRLMFSTPLEKNLVSIFVTIKRPLPGKNHTFSFQLFDSKIQETFMGPRYDFRASELLTYVPGDLAFHKHEGISFGDESVQILRFDVDRVTRTIVAQVNMKNEWVSVHTLRVWEKVDLTDSMVWSLDLLNGGEILSIDLEQN